MATFGDHFMDTLFGESNASDGGAAAATTATTNANGGGYDIGDHGLGALGGDGGGEDVFEAAMGADVHAGMMSVVPGNAGGPGAGMGVSGGMMMMGGIGGAGVSFHGTGVMGMYGGMPSGSVSNVPTRRDGVGVERAKNVKTENGAATVGSPVTEESRIASVSEESDVVPPTNKDVSNGGLDPEDDDDDDDDDDEDDSPGDSSNRVSSAEAKSTVSRSTTTRRATAIRGQKTPRIARKSGRVKNIAKSEGPALVPIRKDTHNSHTKRCRMKVNERFKELVHVLPKPPPDVEVKHKAQILEYAISVFKAWNFKKACLEAQLALCSSSSLNEWVMSTVKKASNLRDALAPFFDLICTKGGWKFAEAWFPQRGRGRNENPTLEFGFGHIPRVINPDDECVRPKIESFLEESRAYRFEPRIGVPGRVVCTMRPEWLPRLDNKETFVRASIAVNREIQVCFAVPIISCGYIAAVGVFYDTRRREYDPAVLELAHNIANTIGNAFGACKGAQGLPATRL